MVAWQTMAGGMRRVVLGAVALLAAFSGVLMVVQPAQAYTVQPGDTIWSIARRNGVTVQEVVRANGLTDPNTIFPGEQLSIPGASGGSGNGLGPLPTTTYTVQQGDSVWSIAHNLGIKVSQVLNLNPLSDPDFIRPGDQLVVPAPPAPARLSPAQARQMLTDAAIRHNLNPAFVLAVAYWESGFNQTVISKDGAIGWMQILPATADWAGPSLLGRQVDLHNPYDNADLGAALLYDYLNEFNDPKLALAAYYQGAHATAKDGIYQSSQNYVNGIWALRNRFNSGDL